MQPTATVTRTVDLHQIVACLKRYIEEKYGIPVRQWLPNEHETRNHALCFVVQPRVNSLRVRLRGYWREFAHIPLGSPLVHYPGQAYCFFMLRGWADLATVLALVDQAIANAVGGDFRIRSRTSEVCRSSDDFSP